MGMMETMSRKMIDGYEETDIVSLMEDMHKTLVGSISEKWKQEILDSIKRSSAKG